MGRWRTKVLQAFMRLLVHVSFEPRGGTEAHVDTAWRQRLRNTQHETWTVPLCICCEGYPSAWPQFL